MSKLTAVQIKKLFGHFDHNLNLERSERITAIIGPNGYGKTISLRLIHSLLSKRFWQLHKINFEEIIYTFADGSYVLAKKHQEEQNDIANEMLIDSIKGNTPTGHLEIYIQRPGQPISMFTPTPPSLNPNSMNTVEAYLPFINRIGPREWYDTVEETKLDVGDLFDKYGDQLPDSFFDTISSESSKSLDELIDGVECRLIETQRLVPSTKRTASAQYSYQQRVRRTTKSSRYAVNQKADRLKEIIKDTTTDYASLSQKLDRSFPRRVIELPDSEVLENLILQDDLELLEAKRKALMDLCIIDQEIEPVRLKSGIPDELRRMMTVYNDDMSKKLGKFDKLSRRIDLFKNILDGRLAGKSVVIDRQEGFKVQSNWEDSEIPLDKLSSGEQHQLVLIFELLFEINPRSLILIDEPELSLHITWQKKFIADLVDIIQLNDFDVVLATHSPQLVGKWWHLTEELGDVEE